MKEYLIKAINIIKPYTGLLVILSIAVTVRIVLPALGIIVIVGLLLIFPIIYGYITEIVTNKKHESLISLYKKHWINFYVVSFILGLPFVLIILLGKAPIFKLMSVIYLLCMTIISIYIVPLIFIKRVNLPAITNGINYLIANFKLSLPLVYLALIDFIVKAVNSASYLLAEDSAVLYIGVSFICNFIGFFIGFIIFITAALVLVNKALKEESEVTH